MLSNDNAYFLSPLYLRPRARSKFLSASATVIALTVLAALAVASATAEEEMCEGGGATPVAVAVTAVPIVVPSTTADSFVLYASHDVDGETVEYPVKVAPGEDGTTTLAENVAALPVERYRAEKYLVTDPADVDGDCIDDITELKNLGVMNPVNSAKVRNTR